MLLHLEWVGDALSALQWRERQHLWASDNHRTQLSGFIRQDRVIVAVSELLNNLFQNQVHQLVVSLQHSNHLSSANELDNHLLVVVLLQVQNGLFLGSVLLGGTAASSVATVVSVVSVISVVSVVSVPAVSSVSISIMELASLSVLLDGLVKCQIGTQTSSKQRVFTSAINNMSPLLLCHIRCPLWMKLSVGTC